MQPPAMPPPAQMHAWLLHQQREQWQQRKRLWGCGTAAMLVLGLGLVCGWIGIATVQYQENLDKCESIILFQEICRDRATDVLTEDLIVGLLCIGAVVGPLVLGTGFLWWRNTTQLEAQGFNPPPAPGWPPQT